MPLNKKYTELDIVWFKRDLRTLDNKSLEFASKSGNQTLFVYIFEPSILDSPDCDPRHIRFIHESIIDIEKRFKKFSLDIKCVNCEVIEFFEEISKSFKIKNVLSYQEIGNNLSYSRDKKIAQFFRTKNIN